MKKLLFIALFTFSCGEDPQKTSLVEEALNEKTSVEIIEELGKDYTVACEGKIGHTELEYSNYKYTVETLGEIIEGDDLKPDIEIVLTLFNKDLGEWETYTEQRGWDGNYEYNTGLIEWDSGQGELNKFSIELDGEGKLTGKMFLESMGEIDPIYYELFIENDCTAKEKIGA